MNESIKTETPRKRDWSVVRKTQIVGVLIGVAITVGIIAYDKATAPHEPVDAAMLLSIVVLGPTAILCKTLGLTVHLYKDNGAGGSSNQFALSVLCVVIIVNSLIGFVAGTIIGKILPNKKLEPQKMNCWSILRRFVYCFLITGLVVPIGFNNGDSAGWNMPAIFALAGLFSGQREEIAFAIKIFGVLILPVTILLFGIWSFIASKKQKNKRPNL